MPLHRPAAAVALAAASLVLAGCSALGGAGGAPTPTSAPGTALDDLAVGDCIASEDQRPTTPTVPVVDCSLEHDNEAYASITVPGDQFPGPDAITAQAQTACSEAFAEFAGIAYDASALDYAYYFPTEGSWAAGDRRILCLIVDPGVRVTGTLEGAGR